MELLWSEYECLSNETVIRHRLMRIDRRLAKNADANLGQGGAADVFSVLVRHLTPMPVWVLVLRMSGYIGYLTSACKQPSGVM